MADFRPLTLADAETEDLTRDITTERGRQVRLARLDLPQKLRVLRLLESLPTDEDGALASQDDAFRFGLELLALAIVDADGVPTFDSERGRHVLGRLHVDDLNELIAAANDLNGLSKANQEEKKTD